MKPQINPNDDFFGAVLNCAVRYSLGRRSYMPKLVIVYIRPLIPYLTDKTLYVMERDISKADDYGNESIDKPEWLKFLTELQDEIRRREK